MIPVSKREDIGIDVCEGVIVRASDKAVLVIFGYPWDGRKKVWVPKQVICEDSELKHYDLQAELGGEKRILVVKEWWARRAGVHPHTNQARDQWRHQPKGYKCQTRTQLSFSKAITKPGKS